MKMKVKTITIPCTSTKSRCWIAVSNDLRQATDIEHGFYDQRPAEHVAERHAGDGYNRNQRVLQRVDQHAPPRQAGRPRGAHVVLSSTSSMLDRVMRLSTAM